MTITMHWKHGGFRSDHASYVGVGDTFPSKASNGRANSHSFSLSCPYETITVPANLWWYLNDENGSKPQELVMRPSNGLSRMLAGHEKILLNGRSDGRLEGWVEECHTSGVVHSGYMNGFVVHNEEEYVSDVTLHGGLVQRAVPNWQKVDDCGSLNKEQMEIISEYSHRAHFLSQMAKNISLCDDMNTINNLVDSISDSDSQKLFGGPQNMTKIHHIGNEYFIEFDHKLSIV